MTAAEIYVLCSLIVNVVMVGALTLLMFAIGGSRYPRQDTIPWGLDLFKVLVGVACIVWAILILVL